MGENVKGNEHSDDEFSMARNDTHSDSHGEARSFEHEKPLLKPYRELVECLDLVFDLEGVCADARTLTILAILEDDITVLLEQCEQYFIDGNPIDLTELISMESLCECVIDEVREMADERELH